MREEGSYFTFPLELLRRAFILKVKGNKLSGIEWLCEDAINYTIYVRCKDYDKTPDEVFKYFRITGNPNAAFERGKQLYDSFTRPVLISVHKSIIFDFFKNPKTDFEIAVFCAFCGLRSIIGGKSYVKTNNGLLMARMFGYATAGEFEKLEIKPTYYNLHFLTKQKVRYQLTERIIRNELSLYWGLKYYSSQSKGFFISFTLDFEDLVTCVEKKRKSTILKLQQQEQKKIIERVKRRVLEG